MCDIQKANSNLIIHYIFLRSVMCTKEFSGISNHVFTVLAADRCTYDFNLPKTAAAVIVEVSITNTTGKVFEFLTSQCSD